MSQNFTRVNEKLFILAEEVPKPKIGPKEVARSSSMNHIWEIDRSGSMHGVLPKLVEDLKAKCRQLPLGDTVTVGWFSGEGDRDFILKGFKLDTVTDFAVLDSIFNKLKDSRGTTCFSEILDDTFSIVTGLAAAGSNFALILFTDGYPVVSNYGREVERIQTALAKLKGTLTASLLVGYGDYYNKELMTSMAATVGGSLVHSSDLASFNVAFNTFVEDAKELGGQLVPMDMLNVHGAQYFTINGKQIVPLKGQQQGGTCRLEVPTTKRAKDYVYAIVGVQPTSKEVDFKALGVNGRGGTSEPLVKGCYAAAYLLTQQLKTDVALDVLAALGDISVIDAVTNAFTNAEYGAAEDKIREAMAAPSKRFAAGRDTGYVPPADAYCFLDLIDDLQEAEFLPAHPAFNYKRIGKAVEDVEGFGKFKASPTNSCEIKTFSWNDKRLNLSLQVTLKGTVNLQDREGKSAKDFGLLPDYPAFVFRNYAIIKDGSYNITQLPITAPMEVLDRLQARGLVDSITLDPVTKKPVAVVELTRVPVVNRSIADGRTSAKALCLASWKETEISGKLKALKYYRDQLEASRATDAAALFGADTQNFLSSNGIDTTKGGLFSPAKKASTSTDFYMAKTFDIAVKGFSSLPKVVDVIEHVEEIRVYDEAKRNGNALPPQPKALKPVEAIVAAGVKMYDDCGLTKKDRSVQLAWLKAEISRLSGEAGGVRRQIQETKFAIVLGKKWFDELTSRDNPTLDVNGYTFTFKLGEEKVAF